ncbi:MAG: SDR family NAD(P)-dependent oxidoreductase [Bosea sp. (in: a-proteobacteria)]
MTSLSGKVVLVTGASKGIGAAIATKLAVEGANVVAHYGRDLAGAQAALAAAPPDRKLFLSADQRQPASMDELWTAALGWHGRVDAVVLNAAVMLVDGGIDDNIDAWDAAWETQWQVNVLAPTRLMRHAVRHYARSGGGVLITISSWAAQRGVTNPAMIAYAASKAAVKAAAQTIARGYAKDNILSYVIAPGVVRTRMSEDFAASQGGEDKVTAMLAMGEWVPPSDIGELAAFLATGKVKHLSGATLDVNGASYIR